MSDLKALSAAMDNVDAMTIGRICRAAILMPAGDNIDTGLALCRLLDEAGYSLMKKAAYAVGEQA